ncbi:MAG: CarD family transcriptional regulator [Clostridiales Family XIII bacterium]|nr:CarD family transcriptional regulator [Clostridiales Family XIII bacterium]
MYEIGDMVIYGTTGVCTIEDIKEMKPPLGGDPKLSYVLKPVYNSCMIYAPIEGGNVAIRDVISKDEAIKLIDSFATLESEAMTAETTHALASQYKEKIFSNSCEELIELTMSIYTKKKGGKHGATDKRFMKQAEELLYGEFAIALGIGKKEVPNYIQERIKTA